MRRWRGCGIRKVEDVLAAQRTGNLGGLHPSERVRCQLHQQLSGLHWLDGKLSLLDCARNVPPSQPVQRRSEIET